MQKRSNYIYIHLMLVKKEASNFLLSDFKNEIFQLAYA